MADVIVEATDDQSGQFLEGGARRGRSYDCVQLHRRENTSILRLVL